MDVASSPFGAKPKANSSKTFELQPYNIPNMEMN
jgi:hypothetical protein